MVLNDGTNVLGSATPRAATPTSPDGETVPSGLVSLVAALSIPKIAQHLDAGELTVDEVRAAEDPANGGRGRLGVESLLTSR